MAYLEVTKCKTQRLHGNGYLAKNPTRRQLLNADRQEQIRREEQQHQEDVELMESFEQLQQQMTTWEADREAERREHERQIEELNKAREADKEQLRQEFQRMLQAANVQAPFQQPNNNVTTSADIAAAVASVTRTEDVQTDSTNVLSSSQRRNLESVLNKSRLAFAIQEVINLVAILKHLPSSPRQKFHLNSYRHKQQVGDHNTPKKQEKAKPF